MTVLVAFGDGASWRRDRAVGAGAPRPRSRSSAASTSSRQVSAERRSIRIRGSRGCGALGLEAHPAEEVGRHHAPPAGAGARRSSARAAGVAEGLDRADPAPLDQVARHRPAPASGPARRRRAPGRPTPWSAARRPARPARSGSRPRRARTPPARRSGSRPARSSTSATRPHEPHSRSTWETQASFSAAAVRRRDPGPAHGIELPEEAGPARRVERGEVVEGEPARSCATSATSLLVAARPGRRGSRCARAASIPHARGVMDTTPARQPSTRLDPYVDRYAARTAGMTASEIRALFAVASRPEVVSLAGGHAQHLRAAARRGRQRDRRPGRHQGPMAMQYGSGQGVPGAARADHRRDAARRASRPTPTTSWSPSAPSRPSTWSPGSSATPATS